MAIVQLLPLLRQPLSCQLGSRLGLVWALRWHCLVQEAAMEGAGQPLGAVGDCVPPAAVSRLHNITVGKLDVGILEMSTCEVHTLAGPALQG